MLVASLIFLLIAQYIHLAIMASELVMEDEAYSKRELIFCSIPFMLYVYCIACLPNIIIDSVKGFHDWWSSLEW